MAQIEIPDLASPSFKADPFPFYARLRAEAPVCRTRLPFWGTTWLVSRYEDVLAVLKDERFAKDYSSKMRWLPPYTRPLNRNLLNLDPPDHTRLRTLVSKAFTQRVVEGMRDRIQRVCDDLLDAAAPRDELEIVGDFALLLPLTIISDLLGIPADDRHRFYSRSKRVAAATSGAAFDVLRSQPALWSTVRYLRRFIALRRAEPQDDLVTALLEAEEAGDKLSEDEVIGMIALLLLAGYETTMGLIAMGALALIRNPEQRQLLERHPDLAETAVEELLRYTSPADFTTFRIARENVRIRSVEIQRGDLMLAGLAAANRDGAQFSDPEILDISREPNRHLAFGVGSHFCMGAPLARLEARIALTSLLTRFPGLRLVGDVESLRWRRGLFFRGLKELPVVLASTT